MNDYCTTIPVWLALIDFFLGTDICDLVYVMVGKSKEEAMGDYITKVKQLLEESA